MGQSALGIVLMIAVASCRVGAFSCDDDDDCAGGGSAGVCEPAGACSFADDGCPSGRRYGERSPGDLAGECVDPVGTTGASADSVADTASSLDATSSEPESTSGADTLPTSDGGSVCPGEWWDCAWSRRVALDLPATATETFTDVPVLVALAAPRIDPTDASPGGVDLRFVTADGTRVPHEIERWDPAGVSLVWIAVPTLGPGDGPRLWLYYGNTAATDDQDEDAVWSPEHAAVWHLQPGVIDASGHGNDGVATEGVVDVAGHLAGSKEFFAVDDRIDVPAADVLDDAFFGGATISAWVRPDTFGGTDRGRIADKSANEAGGWMFYLSDDSGGEVRFRHGYEGGQVIWFSAGEGIVTDAWVHVAVTFDALDGMPPHFYIDGVEQVADTNDLLEGAPVSDVGYDVVIGNSDVPDRWFDGRIDELRIERKIREPAWIEIQYRSMTDELVVYSAPERLEDAQ